MSLPHPTGIPALVAICVLVSSCGGDGPSEVEQPLRYQLRLALSGDGAGTVTSAPAGISCAADGGTCTATFEEGTAVTLSAAPESGHAFTGWDGACSGTASCSITVTANIDVTAAFNDPERVVRTVGPDGGTIVTEDGALELVIPAGALGADVEIAARTLVNPDAPEQVAPGTAYRLEPEGLTFDEPARLTIRYDPDILPEGALEEGLALARLSEGGWTPIDGDTVDATTHAARGEIAGFSDWGVTYEFVLIPFSNSTTGEAPPREYWIVLPSTEGGLPDVVSMLPNDLVYQTGQPGQEISGYLHGPRRCLYDPTEPGFEITVGWPGEAGSGRTWNIQCTRPVLANYFIAGSGSDIRFGLETMDTEGASRESLEFPSPHSFVYQSWGGHRYRQDLTLLTNAAPDPESDTELWSIDFPGGALADPLVSYIQRPEFDLAITAAYGPLVLEPGDEVPTVKDIFLSGDGSIWRTDPGFTDPVIILDSDFFDLAPVPYSYGGIDGLLFNRIGPGFPDLSGWLMFYDPTSGTATQVFEGYIFPWDPVAPGPDGEIVYTSTPYEAGNTHLFRYLPTTGEQTPLTSGESTNFSPSVHETGTLAFISNRRNGKRNVHTMDLDGSNERRLTDSESTGRAPFETRFIEPRNFFPANWIRFRRSGPASSHGATTSGPGSPLPPWLHVPEWVRDRRIPRPGGG